MNIIERDRKNKQNTRKNVRTQKTHQIVHEEVQLDGSNKDILVKNTDY